jgi:uncharacterized protein (TIGR03067 family)
LNYLSAWLLISAWPVAQAVSCDAVEMHDQRIAALVRELGNDDFQMRQAAGRELANIGPPALVALEKAAECEADLEVRWRAQQLAQTVRERVDAAVTQKELEELQGFWTLVRSEVEGKQISGEDKSYVFAFRGDKWSIHAGGRLAQGGIVTRIEVNERLNAIDLAITEEANVGVTAISVYAIEGDTLKYINSGEPRATEFGTKPGDGRYYSIFRRDRRAQ